MSAMPVLAEDEKIIVVGRHHWINLLPVLVGTGLVLAALLGLVYFAGRQPDTVAQFVPLSLALAGITLVAGLLALILIAALWIFRQNRVILTNAHLIQVNQSGLFGRTVSQLGLDNIQDVRASQIGLLATLLGYGDVMIDTAGEEQNFVFRQASRPQLIADNIILAAKPYMSADKP